jgi:ABC-type glycerol-3-phosphate transport system substrate-binding protein
MRTKFVVARAAGLCVAFGVAACGSDHNAAESTRSSADTTSINVTSAGSGSS